MKNPFRSTIAAGGSATDAPDPADEFRSQLEPIVRRRDELNARLADVDAEISQLRNARDQQLLAGEIVTGAVGISAQLEEREALQRAVETLNGQISALEQQKAAFDERMTRAELARQFDEAREAAEFARAAMHSALKEFVKVIFPGLLDAQRLAESRARSAAAAVGQSWGPTRFYSATAANIGAAIESARGVTDSAFEPEKPTGWQ